MKQSIVILGLSFLLLSLNSCDRCADVSCQNGGTCNEGKCNCAYGYEGTLCDKVTISYLAGAYQVSDACTDTLGTAPYSSFVVISGTRMQFSPIETFVNPMYANTDSADGKHILILRQKPDGAVNRSIEGDGQITFDPTTHKAILNLSYTVVDSSVSPPVSTTCTPVFTHD